MNDSSLSPVKIKLCGMFRQEDIAAANACKPEYIGFVFWPKSHRNVSVEEAKALKALLDPSIKAVGVFVNSPVEFVAELLNCGIIDIAQLHGAEDNEYIHSLRALSSKPVIKAFCIRNADDINTAESSDADFVLLDNGTGTGKAFDWKLIRHIRRPFFLAGGLNAENVALALQDIHPYAVDTSSALETDKKKDPEKMEAFVRAVRGQ